MPYNSCWANATVVFLHDFLHIVQITMPRYNAYPLENTGFSANIEGTAGMLFFLDMLRFLS